MAKSGISSNKCRFPTTPVTSFWGWTAAQPPLSAFACLFCPSRTLCPTRFQFSPGPSPVAPITTASAVILRFVASIEYLFGDFCVIVLVVETIEAAARETLEQVMAETLAKSGSNRSAVRAVCLAVSGVNHPSDQQRILDWLRYY